MEAVDVVIQPYLGENLIEVAVSIAQGRTERLVFPAYSDFIMLLVLVHLNNANVAHCLVQYF